jgi:MFS family permease
VIAGVLVTLLAPNSALRIAGVVIFGFGCGPVWTMIFVLASRVFPDRSGAACGVTMLFSTAGGAVFPSLIGAWVGDARTTLLLCVAIAALVVAVASPRRAPRAPPDKRRGRKKIRPSRARRPQSSTVWYTGRTMGALFAAEGPSAGRPEGNGCSGAFLSTLTGTGNTSTEASSASCWRRPSSW